MGRYYRMGICGPEDRCSPWGVKRADGSIAVSDMHWSAKDAKREAARLNREAERLLGEERARLRPLLEQCVDFAEGLLFNHPDDALGSEAARALRVDLRRELGRGEGE